MQACHACRSSTVAFERHGMNHSGLKEMLRAALEGLEERPGAGTPRVVATRQSICDELRAFEEETAAQEVARIPASALSFIFDLAGEIEISGRSRSPGESLCIAAITVIEGRPRPLVRQRRRGTPRRSA